MYKNPKDKLKNVNLARDLYFQYRYYKNYLSLNFFPKYWIKKIYKFKMGYKLNIDNPKSFNEKLQWLKLYWYDKQAKICSNKYTVRNYVTKKGLSHILNHNYGVYDTVEEIDIMNLPDKFVLKLTTGNRRNVICKNKSSINWKEIKQTFKKWQKYNYYYINIGEWVYDKQKPQIIVEQYLEDNNVNDLYDYKIFCFNGKAEAIQVDFDRFSDHKRNIYDTNWNLIPLSIKYPCDNKKHIKKPEKLYKMIEYAEILSEGFPFARVDFYYIDYQIIFGEITFFHGGGYEKFYPEKYDYEFGKKIILPKKNA